MLAAFALLVVAGRAPGVAEAAEFVTNGGFDANADGWTLSNNDGSGGFKATGGNPDGHVTLNQAGEVGTDPTASQDLGGLVVGQTYTITGDYRTFAPGFGDAAKTDALGVLIDGALVQGFARPATNDTWESFSTTFVATSATHTLALAAERDGDDSSFDIDNISVDGPASAPPPSGTGGPVILGGDDLTDHGGLDGGGNPEEGWLYMQRALENISAQVTRAGNDGSVAALGTADGVGEAGEAINAAAGTAGLTVTHYDGAAAINGFFADLASGTTNPGIIWTAGTGASGDLESDEGVALADNAAAIASFVASGGGLLSHGSGETAYGWLSALLPGLVNVETGSDGDLYRTPAGEAQFPSVTNDDFNAGPWHSHFEGSLGGLTVLVRSADVQDNTGADAAVVIGGSKAVLAPTAPPSPAAAPPPPISLTVTKAVEGDAPDGLSYGFVLDCFGFDTTFSLAAGESHTTASFPANTRCTLTETDDGGAVSTTGEFSDQLLSSSTAVTVRNTFPVIPQVAGTAITKALVSGSPAAVGERVRFDIAVTFDGGPLRNVELVDVYEHDVLEFDGVYIGSTPLDCTVFAGIPDAAHSTVGCALGDATGPFTVQARFTAVAPTVPGASINQASVLSDQDGEGGDPSVTTGPVADDVEIVEVLALPPLGDGDMGGPTRGFVPTAAMALVALLGVGASAALIRTTVR